MLSADGVIHKIGRKGKRYKRHDIFITNQHIVQIEICLWHAHLVLLTDAGRIYGYKHNGIIEEIKMQDNIIEIKIYGEKLYALSVTKLYMVELDFKTNITDIITSQNQTDKIW